MVSVRERADTVEQQGLPVSLFRSLCDPKRTCQAFVSEFRGNHTHRLQMCGATAANVDWPQIFGTAPCFAEASFKLLGFRILLTITFASHWIAFLILYWNEGYWLIYWTNWSFTVQLFYFLFLVYTTHEARESLLTRLPPSAFESWIHLPWFVKVTWGLFHIALPASLLVFLLYWTLVNPVWTLKYSPLYLRDVFPHGVNLLFLIIDASFSRVPYYVKYCLLFFIYACVYLSFSLLHFFLEIGTHRGCKQYEVAHKCPIYDPLDWHKVTRTGILVFAILLCVVPLCQIPLWRLIMCRRRVDLYWRSSGETRESELALTAKQPTSDSQDGEKGTWGAPPPPGDEGASMEKTMSRETVTHW
mmetsp:Transcript_85758/g.135445  ORF Transcript_85758/g.135445 Transcript_85758/m.135445 type:complete len:359 (+) Transcript_85758:63-1139(+)